MPTSAGTPEGKRVVLTDEYWRHIKFRHPEIKHDTRELMEVVANPDETYRDARGGVHALKRLDESHFTVVIYEFENGGFGTAFDLPRDFLLSFLI